VALVVQVFDLVALVLHRRLELRVKASADASDGSGVDIGDEDGVDVVDRVRVLDETAGRGDCLSSCNKSREGYEAAKHHHGGVCRVLCVER